MLCCTECFNDEFLKDYIEKNGSLGNCDYCATKEQKCINVENLSNLFRPLLNVLEPIGLYDTIEFTNYESTWDIIDERWQIFSDKSKDKKELIMRDMFVGEEDLDGLEHRYQSSENNIWKEMLENGFIQMQWDEFKKELQYKNRFFLQSDSKMEVISELLEGMVEVLSIEDTVFRARISQDKEKLECPMMGKPDAMNATAGRANPQGIPYLYLASDFTTALAEVRPELNQKTTVAEFEIIKKLNCIDLRKYKAQSPFKFGEKLKQYVDNSVLLAILGHELSKPVNSSDSFFEYLPTQYISEFIKSKGYDGILYQSSVGDGYNIVIFEESGKLRCKSTKEYKLTNIDLLFEELIEE